MFAILPNAVLYQQQIENKFTFIFQTFNVMQSNLWKIPIVGLVILLAVLLPFAKGGVKAAPQSRELFKSKDEINLKASKGQIVGIKKVVTKDSETAAATNEHDTAVKIKEVDKSVREESKENQEKPVAKIHNNSDKEQDESNEKNSEKNSPNKHKNDSAAPEHSKGEDHKKKANEKKISRENQMREIIAEHIKDQHEPQLELYKNQHKLRTRQTEDDTSLDDIVGDELVSTLLRQPNDFIAAAGMSQSPRPVQAMRVNMNSGL
ncbi:uncharacterized protein [Musca autumnalis]|uniref:uncharacterized protein n=1 Tax=Musca autumnalis TaxID=221902 RepID=UPI003CF41A13